MLQGVVDCQQTGFVSVRNIVENVLNLCLAQEWALTSNHHVIFVKLDFLKAYDRVSHTYLWATLTKLGMDAGRRRCYRIKGLNIDGKTTMLHQLYVDDTEISVTMEESQFHRLKEIIEVFETISGVTLNLAKSLIMPLAPTNIPAWERDTGCKIATPGIHFTYLGVLASSPMDEAAIAKAIVSKIEKRLAHWSNRLLSWPAKTLLLKHVLSATPLYQLMSVGLANDGIEALEKLCRQFIWGWSETGDPKKALIAWERIA
ncbi:hypothetical protein R1sor_008984 [Riccia sorocarpa]|uniref:Reverse transcriptase domain-containing protein n=1 Tax=Riccia sorocarpa TaxID=122646 RepID=A0ABD3H7R8_9MARC